VAHRASRKAGRAIEKSTGSPMQRTVLSFAGFTAIGIVTAMIVDE
jgi:hypothetical protein